MVKNLSKAKTSIECNYFSQLNQPFHFEKQKQTRQSQLKAKDTPTRIIKNLNLVWLPRKPRKTKSQSLSKQPKLSNKFHFSFSILNEIDTTPFGVLVERVPWKLLQQKSRPEIGAAMQQSMETILTLNTFESACVSAIDCLPIYGNAIRFCCWKQEKVMNWGILRENENLFMFIVVMNLITSKASLTVYSNLINQQY